MNGILRKLAGPNRDLDGDGLFFAREVLINILNKSLIREASEPGAEDE